ncbi:MAG: thioredoxin reductase [Firmicutes bacterium HGW-Firmicutes-12]|nr:MAG: thioredoxin reductase [Firmicutes bacterium HGW-Firmicutes-12]
MINIKLNETYEIIIIGCGPAGLSAAINANIREKEILLLGGEFCTARLYKAPHVDNYLGFQDISGKELRSKFLAHLKKTGIEIHSRQVSSIFSSGESLQAMIDDEIITAQAIILATGLSTPKYIAGEQELVGKGISYCATCDAALYRGKNVIVLGETEEAEEEANFMVNICNTVSYFSLYGSPHGLNDKVNIIKGKPKSIQGKSTFSALETEQETYEADGLFIIREVTPVSQLLPELSLDNNFIKVNHDMATNLPGVYAAGDCTGPPFQVAKSVGEGLVAALSAAKYIDHLARTTKQTVNV